MIERIFESVQIDTSVWLPATSACLLARLGEKAGRKIAIASTTPATAARISPGRSLFGSIRAAAYPPPSRRAVPGIRGAVLERLHPPGPPAEPLDLLAAERPWTRAPAERP